MAETKQTCESMRLLEHSMLKIPFDLMNKNARIVSRAVEKECTKCNTTVKELLDTIGNTSPECLSSDEVSHKLSALIENLKNAKKKASENLELGQRANQSIRTRLDHLKQGLEADPPTTSVGSTGNGNFELASWRDTRLLRMLVDYFQRQGFYKSACALDQFAKLEQLTNVKSLGRLQRLEEALKAEKVEQCLAWCKENSQKLKKLGYELEFDIRQQEFIDFIKTDRRCEAVEYMRDYITVLSPTVERLQETMGLLAYSSDCKTQPYKRLFSADRWIELGRSFRFIYFLVNQLQKMSSLELALQCGISALKMQECYDGRTRSHLCPVCTLHVRKIGQPLPFCHTLLPSLTCRIDGSLLNEVNVPYMLPNGHCYGEKGLGKMAKANDGYVSCLETGEQFKFSECKRVYLM